MGKVIGYFSKKSKLFITALGFFSVTLLGLLDYLTGPWVSFSIFYLIPILIVTWFVNRWAGILLSIISTISWHIADWVWGVNYTNLAIPYWNSAVRLGFFLIVVFIMSAFRELKEHLERRVAERTAAIEKEITERKRAEERLRETAERLQALSQRLAEIQEAERMRLVEVLHDHIGQNLTALSINLNIINNLLSLESATKIGSRLEDSLRLMERTTLRIQDVMSELYPPVLKNYGLLVTLFWFGQETSTRTGLEITVEGKEPIPRLPIEKETALFRITQEAINNIIKHAHAKHIGIRFESDSFLARLIISDNGVGFDPASVYTNNSRHWGMLIMHGRADAMGGHLHVDSQPGQGTKVTVEVGR